MSQHDMDIANGGGATVRADIIAAIQALATNSSGTSAPSPTFANQWWVDLTALRLKRRNTANSAWIDICDITASMASLLANTFTAAQTIAMAGTLGTALLISSTDAGATGGPDLELSRLSASPAASDILARILWTGKDDAGNTETYAQLLALLLDPTNGSEDGALVAYAKIAGALTAIATFGPGLQVGAPTGGDKGLGTVNASAFYNGGVKLRERLGGNRTYYVRTDGNDSNDGLANTAGGAFLTLQKAYNVAMRDLDYGGQYIVTIQVADGTYTAGVVASDCPGSLNYNRIVFAGNSGTPGNVVVSVTNGDCFGAYGGASFTVKDMELRTTTSGNCLVAAEMGQIAFNNVRFGACAGNHIQAAQFGRAVALGNYSIVGGALVHGYCYSKGTITLAGITVTLTGTPAFTNYFVRADLGGLLRGLSTTWTGAATGTRYLSQQNSIIDTNGGGANYFPGNAAGSTATGGLYI